MRTHNCLTLIILGLSLLMTGCKSQKKSVEPTVIYTTCTQAMQDAGQCIRYMDRKIYFAQNVFDEPTTNNSFDVETVKVSLNEFATNTGLGQNYFQYQTVQKEDLPFITEATSVSNWKSFIQILPDSEFNTLFAEVSSPDPNAILMVNRANKRQFWIALRESCFRSSNQNCTNNGGTIFTSNKGLNALVGRTLGRMVGLTPVDCYTYPNHGMCAQFPSDNQWSPAEKNRLYDIFNNQLETIGLNPNFYQFFNN